MLRLGSKFIFYIFLFLCFAVPERNFFLINIFNIATVNILQVCAFILPLTYWFANIGVEIKPRYLNNSIILFLLYLFFSSLFKAIYVSRDISHIFFDYRINAVFVAAGLIIILGIRIELYKWFKLFLIAIFISYIFSLVFFFFDFRLEYNSPNQEIDEYTTFRSGRLINGNKDFAVLGLYFLFTRRDILPFIGRGSYVFITWVSITSLIVALLNFDRTLLALLAFEFLLLFWKYKKSLISVLFPVFVSLATISFLVVYAYSSNEAIKNQVDKRILSIFQSQNQVSEFRDNVWEDSRDFMITGAMDTFNKYPLWGTNIEEPLFFYPDGRGAMQTDVTFLNILARNGLFGFVFFILIFYRLIKFLKKIKSYKFDIEEYLRSLLLFIIPLFLIYSLNHDAIYRSVLIIVIALLFNSTIRRKLTISNS